jgi:hypothetical protein
MPGRVTHLPQVWLVGVARGRSGCVDAEVPQPEDLALGFFLLIESQPGDDVAMQSGAPLDNPGPPTDFHIAEGTINEDLVARHPR